MTIQSRDLLNVVNIFPLIHIHFLFLYKTATKFLSVFNSY